MKLRLGRKYRLLLISIILYLLNPSLAFCQRNFVFPTINLQDNNLQNELSDTIGKNIRQQNQDTSKIQQSQDPYQGQPIISNVFYETDLRQAIQDIAVQAEMTIIADNTVQGFVTMEITDLPLELALKRILSVGGFTFKKLDVLI